MHEGRGPSLLFLPVEIIQQIMRYLYHSDIENITLSCNYLFDVLRPSLEQHRSLKRRFSKISCGAFGGICTWIPHPADMLLECLSYEPISLYPTDLRIGDCSHRQDFQSLEARGITPEPDPYASASGCKIREQYEHLQRLISILSSQTDRIGRKWDLVFERILAYHKGPIMALLLKMLPNIQYLSYEDHRWGHASPLLSFIQEIAVANHTNPNAVHPLSRLHTLNFPTSKPYLEAYRPFHLLAPFVGFPSLRSVHAENLFGSGSHSERFWKKVPVISNIVKLELQNCCINVTSLRPLMCRVQQLRDFSYRYRTCYSYAERGTVWEPRRILAILIRYARHTLRSLTLVNGGGPGSPKCQISKNLTVGSLRAFEALKFIQIDLAMLIDDPRDVLLQDESYAEDSTFGSSESEDGEIAPSWYLGASNQRQVIHRLINVVPASAEHLVLEMLANKGVLLQMLQRLPERKAVRLPNLKEIVYECEERCVTGMEEPCEEVGVMLSQRLKYGEYKNEASDSTENEDLESDYADSPEETESE